MDSAKNVRWIIPFKKFGMVRVKFGTGSQGPRICKIESGI